MGAKQNSFSDLQLSTTLNEWNEPRRYHYRFWGRGLESFTCRAGCGISLLVVIHTATWHQNTDGTHVSWRRAALIVGALWYSVLRRESSALTRPVNWRLAGYRWLAHGARYDSSWSDRLLYRFSLQLKRLWSAFFRSLEKKIEWKRATEFVSPNLSTSRTNQK